MAHYPTVHQAKVFLCVSLFLGSAGALSAQVFDEVTLKDGSHIIGEIVTMTEGTMKLSTAFGGELNVLWSEVASIKTVKPLPFVLLDGTQLVGLAQPGGEGNLDIKSDQIAQPSTVSMANVKEINPPEKKPIIFKGNLGFGGSISNGNTQTRTMSLLAEFEARSERQRLTMRGGYNYADDEDGVTSRNGRVNLKYDFFITKRFYWYASAFFEHDGMQDLSLRTALSTGPGFQIVDKGDFTADWLKEMQLFAEAGIAYFSEDYRRAEDDTYVSARWAVKFDWPFVPKKLTFFHYHEGYPSLEDAEDLYITTETGLRFSIWSNFVATAQINWRWDNTPAPGFKRSDTVYLLTVGYNFEF